MEKSESKWQINVDYAPQSRFKKFEKKHEREFDSVFANLVRLCGILDLGHAIGSFNVGFLRSEGDGVYRIGQTGVQGAKETRLYIYPKERSREIYVLGIGTKETQDTDIREAKKLAGRIEEGKGITNG
jgi:putative component of toxin-antitoxin plasmid stabilization module